MKQEINFEERKRIQLGMLDEIDAFCRANSIRYSIAFGTLLGAIRHKGFIPWDDDVDIMMPLPDLLKLKQLFKSDTMEYLDVDTLSTYGFSFSRISDKSTYDKCGLLVNSYGICIDVYVLVGIPDNYEMFFKTFEPLFQRRMMMMKWKSRASRYLSLRTIPYYSHVQKSCRDYLFNQSVEYEKANHFYIIAGPLRLREKMTYDRDLFSELCELPFEDRKYMAISAWDYFLTLRYGDYMQLPPEDQRHPYHGGHYFFKNRK